MVDTHPEVLVAGAGPVGMFAALALAKRGIHVHVVDSALQPGMHSYALALHPRSLELLRDVGLHEAVVAESYPVHTIALFDQTQRRAEVRVGDGTANSCLAVLRQDVLEELLEAALEVAGASVSWSHRLSRAVTGENAVNATIETLEKESRGYAVSHTEWVVAGSKDVSLRFVIGADGNSSWVRRMLRIGFPEVAKAQYFAVFEFPSDVDLRNEMRIAFSEGTTNVLWPLPEGRVRWSFELPSYGARDPRREKDRFAIQLEAGDYPILAEEQLRALLAERAPWFTGSIGEIEWRIVVRFERRLAESFGRERMWLAGDAAHLTGPAGVQSMNSGLAEASDLADIIERTVRGQDSAGAFEEYDRKHMRNWRALLGLRGGLQPTGPTDPWVAANASALLACLPAIGPELAVLAGHLKLELAASAVVGV
jgi:2-polyprenyl-6-methoxyphenol hydroxylase-like FAD-dependent oxidoreductase